LKWILRGHKLNGVDDSNLPFRNIEALKVGYFFMERSEKEAKLISMLDIRAIVETHDKRLGTGFAKSLQPSENRISRPAETKQVSKNRSRTMPRDKTSISNSEKKISLNEETKAYEVNDSEN
jgi:hypothetical protein